MTPVPVFDGRDKAWRWFAIDSLYVKDGRVTGALHREDGPAVALADGSREWWIKGWFCGDEEAWRAWRSLFHLS